MKRYGKMILAAIVLLFVVIFTVCVFASPDRVYISSAGSDSNDGGSPAEAVVSFSRAFSLLPDGGEIVLCGESYSVGGDFSFPKSEKKYILSSTMSGAFS